MKRSHLGIAAFMLVLLLMPIHSASAQFAIGGGYQLRDESPESGYTVFIEKGFLKNVPMLRMGMRLHVSQFSEDYRISSLDGLIGQVGEDLGNISSDMKTLDYGLALLLGVNLGIVTPYAGAGIGNENYEINYDLSKIQMPSGDVDDLLSLESLSDSGFYWNGFVGATLSPIPIVKPFFEYRFTSFMTEEAIDYTQNGRITIGLKLEF
jgi:opacity protein-like surface antigen